MDVHAMTLAEWKALGLDSYCGLLFTYFDPYSTSTLVYDPDACECYDPGQSGVCDYVGNP